MKTSLLNTHTLLKQWLLILLVSLGFASNSFGINNGIFKVNQLSTKVYHNDIKDWDSWTAFTPVDNEISDIKFVEGKVIVNVSHHGQSFQFDVEKLVFDRATSGNWNIYNGIAKRNGITLGTVVFHFPDDQRIEDYKRGSIENQSLTMYLEFIGYNGTDNLKEKSPIPELHQMAVSFKISR